MDAVREFKRITLSGLVQGIGFRPYVARLAKEYLIEGEVFNSGGAVTILASATYRNLNLFIDELLNESPPLSDILHVKTEELTQKVFEKELSSPYCGFRIVESRNECEELVILPSDLPVCDACLSEMKSPTNRRHKHSLISCTNCGPRYSIIKKAPYDRINTAMNTFGMCPSCEKEYKSEDSRRFHAQTVSCHCCGPQLRYIDNTMNKVLQCHEQEVRDISPAAFFINKSENALLKAIDHVKNGGVVAVKGIGGYHFICSPYNDKAVKSLRELKDREQKPFAVCFPSVEYIKDYARISEKEEALLLSKARPIVLLEKKADTEHKPLSVHVLKNSRYVGAFLPYTPILVRMCDSLGAIVATSANLTDAPIINKENELEFFDPQKLSGVLTHERDIIASQDDSVAWVVNGESQLIRRARGYTPLPVYIEALEAEGELSVLALGGELKSTFCLQKGAYAFLSQYLGDLQSAEALSIYKENLSHMKTLLRIEPRAVACDLHPDYATTLMAKESGLPVIMVQHHHAHVAAVMAEKALNEAVIGISFDGTGFGMDNTIWGGEFLICEGSEFKRAAYLRPVKLLMGNDSVKDCLKTATAYLHAFGLGYAVCDDRYPVIKSALDNNINTVFCSSLGRLFDAVSSMLGFSEWSGFEAEAAILLENAAHNALGDKTMSLAAFDIIERDGALILDPKAFIESMMHCLSGKREDVNLINEIALGFHQVLCEAVLETIIRLSEKTGIFKIVLCGGVFQNKILTETLARDLKGKGFFVYQPSQVPSNDGGISLGQAYIAMQRLKRG